MVESIMFNLPINQLFTQLTNKLDEPVWIQHKRQQALSRFQEYGVPTRKSELWKYTDVKKLQKLPQVSDIAESDEHFVFTIKSDIAENTGMLNYKDIKETNWHDLDTDTDRVFIDLNMAMLNAGFELSIPDNGRLKLHIQYQQVTDAWQNIRTVINIGENAQLDLTESYDYDCRINHVAIINAANNAKIKLQSHKHLAKSAALLHYNKINCAENVSIRQSAVNNNAALAHTIQDIDFNGVGADFKAASVNVCHESCHVAEHINTNHIAAACKSEVIKRSLAAEKSHIVVNAKAFVNVAADGSDVSQSLKNILLSEQAKISSRPELEINTDDVIAAHGSTIGELDQLSLDYLRSRGIPIEQAKLMLIESFLQEANIFASEDFLNLIEL